MNFVRKWGSSSRDYRLKQSFTLRQAVSGERGASGFIASAAVGRVVLSLRKGKAEDQTVRG